jgi:hypothetical protein
MAINVHQVTSEKRLESHDEQLMLIIPVVGRYITRRCCDCWVVVTRRGLLLIGLHGPEEDFSQLLGF